jgi:hypothetical protein
MSPRSRAFNVSLALFSYFVIKPTLVIVPALLMAWLWINWITGCGETFITAYGAHIPGDCVFYPFD